MKCSTDTYDTCETFSSDLVYKKVDPRWAKGSLLPVETVVAGIPVTKDTSF